MDSTRKNVKSLLEKKEADTASSLPRSHSPNLESLTKTGNRNLGQKKSQEEPLNQNQREDFSEEEEGGYHFTSKQRLQLFGTIIASFLFFALFLFPYQKLARYSFFKFSKQVSLNTGHLDLSFFGTSFVDDISLPFGEGGGIGARQLEIAIPLLKLIGNSIDGELRFKELQYFSSALAFSMNELFLSLDLERHTLALNQWEGNVNMDGKNFKLLQLNLPQLESLGVDLSQLKVQKLELKLAFEQGKLNFDGSQLLSNYFTLNLKGFSQLKEPVTSSRLNAKICIIASPDLESLNSELMGIYILAGGSAGGELCLKVAGNLLKPDFEKANRGGFSESLSTETGTPPEPPLKGEGAEKPKASQ